MSVEENRNCSCNSNMNNNIVTNYNMTMPNMETNYDCNNQNDGTIDCNVKMAMLHQIMCYDFAITELALYLDTHPEDEKALCLHRKYCKESKELKDKYQKVYGPLTINYPCNKWRWLEEPWPWEGGIY